MYISFVRKATVSSDLSVTSEQANSTVAQYAAQRESVRPVHVHILQSTVQNG